MWSEHTVKILMKNSRNEEGFTNSTPPGPGFSSRHGDWGIPSLYFSFLQNKKFDSCKNNLFHRYRSFHQHSNDFETWPGKRLRPDGLWVKFLHFKNSVMKSLKKIRFEKIQNRRPHGFSIKHGGFWGFWMCRASADDQSPDIPFRIRWPV